MDLRMVLHSTFQTFCPSERRMTDLLQNITAKTFAQVLAKALEREVSMMETEWASDKGNKRRTHSDDYYQGVVIGLSGARTALDNLILSMR